VERTSASLDRKKARAGKAPESTIELAAGADRGLVEVVGGRDRDRTCDVRRVKATLYR
jgi:hypothetical protein